MNRIAALDETASAYPQEVNAHLSSAMVSLSRASRAVLNPDTPQLPPDFDSVEFLNKFTASVRQRIEKHGAENVLYAYDRGYFEWYQAPPAVIVLVCDRLIGLANEFQIEPFVLWQDLIAAHGIVSVDFEGNEG